MCSKSLAIRKKVIFGTLPNSTGRTLVLKWSGNDISKAVPESILVARAVLQYVFQLSELALTNLHGGIVHPPMRILGAGRLWKERKRQQITRGQNAWIGATWLLPTITLLGWSTINKCLHMSLTRGIEPA